MRQDLRSASITPPTPCGCARGTPIDGNDLWIAAHALAEGAVLVTNNEAEFGRIEGLAIENWVR